MQELHTVQGFFVMFFGRGKDFCKELFVNISSPVPSINNVQSLSCLFIEYLTKELYSCKRNSFLDAKQLEWEIVILQFAWIFMTGKIIHAQENYCQISFRQIRITNNTHFYRISTFLSYSVYRSTGHKKLESDQ